eukprot:3537852-Prymnesium_polylepis.1
MPPKQPRSRAHPRSPSQPPSQPWRPPQPPSQPWRPPQPPVVEPRGLHSAVPFLWWRAVGSAVA